MNNTELKAIADKREADIQKLQGYINAGKTIEEKIVANLIKKIKKAEQQLLEANYEVSEILNDDGTLVTVSPVPTEDILVKETNTDVENQQVEESPIQETKVVNTNKTKESAKAKARKSSFGTKKKEEEKETEILSVKFTEDVATAFENEKAITKKTASAVATELLTNIYNPETNTFRIDIPANHKMQTKDTTLNLPKELKDALIANAKAKNMKTYEYFNKLMEAILDGVE
ncbi:hypothetical protein N2W45_003046 [Clostridium perfringens]|uniref:hypothetical protein n=1 Tax=Clostridium perfringens TaxID=1502 RepID=UPI0018AAA1FD|nr:hypothetical protein [Clostridium perfringens]EJT6500007.1 hypothetical protein [Clostridium perfringens]